MTESIKFGPEWLRNSVANVSSSSTPNSTSSMPPGTDSITCRPVLSDHRYGREEMLSLCDKSTRLPDVLTRFRRLYVTEWQTPLALQPNTDDERTLGSSTTWGPSHIRPLMPSGGMGRGGPGIIRGGSIERGRGRGRGLYHGSAGYTRSTSLYDEEGRRTGLWLDRNGTESAEWSGTGSAVSPRKEYLRAGSGGMENWRKGTRDESGGPTGDVDWRSSSNGTATAREKWARSTSWRDGDTTGEASGPPNGQQQQSSSPPTGGGQVPSSAAPTKAQALYKKSWDEDHLPEWATESFDYGGTFDSSGAFHDGERDHRLQQDDGKVNKSYKMKPEVKKEEPKLEEEEVLNEPPPPPMNHFDGRGNDVSNVPAKYLNFLNESEAQQATNFNNGPAQNSSIQHIDRMQEVADLVANLIMEDDTKDVKVPAGPPVQPPVSVDWFYRDPQGDTQGPFTAQDMSEWYKAGYFQESLMVRRSIDNAFMPLGQLVKVYGRNAPFMAAILMEPIQPPPPVQVEMDPFRLQQQQRMIPPPDANGWNMMTPEQQILMLNMRLAHQRPPVPDPYVMKPPAVPAQQMDLRRMMGAPAAPPAQEMDPIQQLLMQLQKTGGSTMDSAQQWMKSSAPPQMMIPQGGNNIELLPQAPVMGQQQIPQNQAPPSHNWNQAPMSIWDMPKMEQSQHQMGSHAQQEIHAQPEPENVQNGIIDDSQFQQAPMKQSQEAKKKKQQQQQQQKDEIESKKQAKEAQLKQNSAGGKKKTGNDKQQKKEERSNQPAAPAPWVGHQTPANGASLAKIQKTEAQRRQGEMAAQRERDHQKMQMIQTMEMQKNDGLKWAAPPVARVKTLDEIQAEEQKAASIQQEREAVAYAKREAAKKEAAVVTNDASIWNQTPHSMAWQQPKVWSGEQQSGSGFWEEPTKSTNNAPKNAQMLTKSQTMATITTNKQKQQQTAPAKKQAQPAKKPVGEKKEKKDDNNNEFIVWCTRSLNNMNSELDVPTFVNFLQDIESPFEVKEYIKMYLGEAKEYSEFAKQFLERRSKQRNQQRLQNAHIDDMCSPAPAITPSVNSGLSNEFQEVKGKNKKVKAKKVMKVLDGRILGFTATSASDRINVGDRDYGEV